MPIRRIILLLGFLINLTPKAYCGQINVNPQNLLFSHLTTFDGLSYNAVNCIFKDSRGFIWVGTNDGLNCYDGRSFKIYHHQYNDSTTLAGETVLKIAEDTSHNLWIATIGGVSRLNLHTSRITSYSQQADNAHSLLNNAVHDVLITKSGRILFATNGGIDEFDKTRGYFIHRINETEVPGTKKEVNSWMFHIYEDGQGRIWVAGYAGFFQLNLKTDSFSLYTCPATSSNPVIDNQVTSFFEDHTGRFWLTTWGGGLKLFNPEERTFKTYKWQLNPNIPSAANIAFGVAETRERSGQYHLWICTPDGLGEFDPKTAGWTFSKTDPQNPNTINGNYVTAAYTDSAGLLWLSTTTGVNVLDPNKQFFTTHKFGKAFYGTKATGFGQVMCTLADGPVYWVTTWYGNGLYKLDSNFNLLKKWYTIPPGATDPNNFQVSDVVRDKTFLWLSTFNGLVRFDEGKNEFKIFLPGKDTSNNYPSPHIIKVFIDSHQRYWVFFYHKGFSWFNPQNGEFTRTGLKADGNDINYEARDVLEDNKGNVWLVLNKKILIYDYKLNDYRNLDYPPNFPRTLFTSILQDHSGKMWIGTDEGVWLLDPSAMKSEFISRSMGLSNIKVTGMLEDRQHRIWIATKNGLNLYDPSSKTFRLFTQNDGLESNDLTLDLRSMPDGRFLIGGPGYITEFNPDSLSYNHIKPPVVITGCKVFGVEIPVPLNNNNEKQVTLSYKQNEFSFDFAVLNFTNPGSNRYFCYMEGFDKNWRQLEKGEVSYTNLDPGEYLFRVKGANDDGVLNEKGDFVRIIITPPYWKTWWFRIGAMILISGLLALFVSYRINLIRQEEARKTEFNRRIAEARMQALRAQMNPHFIFNSLNSIKECVVTGKNEEAGKYLSKFSKLVRIILENSAKDKITLADEISYLTLYLEVESLRFSDDFSFVIHCDGNIETDLIEIPPMLIQPYIENALWHGLAHKKGARHLQVEFSEQNDLLICTIEDNGIGREAAKAFKHSSHPSVAMKNTSERFTLLGNRASVEIIDLPEASGTKVILKIPV